jgi:hypothetical protein
VLNTKSRKRSASERTDNEDPDLLDRLIFAIGHRKKRRSDRTSRVHRSASETDAKKVDEDKDDADDDTGNLAILFFRSDAQDGKNEDEGQNDFRKDGKNVAARGDRVVGAKTAARLRHQSGLDLVRAIGETRAALIPENEIENGRAKNRADKLSAQIDQEVLEAHLLRD